MDVLVVLALIVGFIVCLLPGIMAWSYYFGFNKRVYRKDQ